MTHQFKVGDRVRAKMGCHYMHRGHEGTVVWVGEDGGIMIDNHPRNGSSSYDETGRCWCDSDWFDKVDVNDGSIPGSLASSLLTEAAEIVAGTRNTTHGHKERSFTVIAEFWESYVTGRKEGREAPITARNVAQMMELLKIARSVQGQPVRDHFVDGAGYSAVAGELAELEGA